MSNFAELEQELGLTFKNTEILRLAFVHRSYVNENDGDDLDSNERLEFLGDSVLEMAATRFLFDKFSSKPEGELTAIRSALVRGKHLGEVASKLNLGRFLILSKGEDNSGGRSKKYILANAIEALIGAIYLDRGYEAAEKFIHRYILQDVESIIAQGLHIDAKTKFQELAQEKANSTPDYRLIAEKGPDHNKSFEMGVYLGEELIAKGSGSSKQKAEQEAAQKALKVKKWS